MEWKQNFCILFLSCSDELFERERKKIPFYWNVTNKNVEKKTKNRLLIERKKYTNGVWYNGIDIYFFPKII